MDRWSTTAPTSPAFEAHHNPYDWLSAYLETNGLRGIARALIATSVLALGAIPLVMAFSGLGPTGTVGLATSIAITVCCAVSAGSWLADWPTRRQSVLFVITATGCIAAACLVHQQSEAALMGGFAFIALAVYVAFFHGLWLLVGYLAVALGVLGYLSWKLAVEGEDPVLTACKFVLMLMALLAASVCHFGMLRLLRADAGRGTRDALTGLLTRPGFKRAAARLLGPRQAKGPRTSEVFAVFMIDLDHFKAVNDTKGHAEGDRALVAVADALGSAVRSTAAVGRLGGEEFAVADVVPRVEVEAMAERLRRAIAATAFRITASVGTSMADPRSMASKDFSDSLNRLMDRADAAMYDAKREGGDRCVISGSARGTRRRAAGMDDGQRPYPTGPQAVIAPSPYPTGPQAVIAPSPYPTGPQPVISTNGNGSANGQSTDSGRWPALPEAMPTAPPDPSWSTHWG